MSTERAEKFLSVAKEYVSEDYWNNADTDYVHAQAFVLMSVAQSLLVIAQELVKINERAERSRE